MPWGGSGAKPANSGLGVKGDSHYRMYVVSFFAAREGAKINTRGRKKKGVRVQKKGEGAKKIGGGTEKKGGAGIKTNTGPKIKISKKPRPDPQSPNTHDIVCVF